MEATATTTIWEHRYVYDVTDYQSILRDSVEIEVHYQGWSSGFSATLDFEMIEGTPARNLIKMQNVYRPRGFSFRNTADVELNHLPAVDIPLEGTTQFAALHVLPSGHGFDNSLNCAEFCKKDYFVKLDGQIRFTQSMWRDDCGLNPVFPQGGTWLYDRANWCPGSKAWTYEHDLSPWISAGQTAQIDLDLEPYSVPSGDPQAASYNWSTILLEFDSYAHQNDVELMEILSPSIHEEYSRMNPFLWNRFGAHTQQGRTTTHQLCDRIRIRERHHPQFYLAGRFGYDGGRIGRTGSRWSGRLATEPGKRSVHG